MRSSSGYEEEVLIWWLCFHGLNAKWTGKALRFQTQKAEQRPKHGALWDTASLRSVTAFQLGLSAKESQLLYPVWIVRNHSWMCAKSLWMPCNYLLHSISLVWFNDLIILLAWILCKVLDYRFYNNLALKTQIQFLIFTYKAYKFRLVYLNSDCFRQKTKKMF